jgi:N-acetylneuraminate lyase
MDGTQKRFRVLIAAPFTPFHADGSLDLERIDALADRLVADGVFGAFVCGTTGEGASLTTAERMLVAARWALAVRDRLRLFVHVGHTSAADARTLAAHAQRIGADAIGCLAPYFFRPRSVEELADFCGHVASAAAGLPFYYYHLPSLTGVAFPMADFLPIAARRIPTLAGIKYTFEDVADFAACAAFDGGRFDMLFGRDELLLEGLDAGACGAIGSTYNYMASIYGRLVDAWSAGDRGTARQFQDRATRITEVMNRHGGLPAGKRIMSLSGLDCGPVRPPLVDLDTATVSRLQAELVAAGHAFV